MTATAPDEANSVAIEPAADGFPPLMLLAVHAMKPEDFSATRDVILDAQARRLPLMFPADYFKVFQLVDGRWTRID